MIKKEIINNHDILWHLITSLSLTFTMKIIKKKYVSVFKLVTEEYFAKKERRFYPLLVSLAPWLIRL